VAFPGVMLKKSLSFTSDAWNVVLFLISYNICDTLGKNIASNRKLFNGPLTIFLFFLRFINIFLYIYIAIGGDYYDWI
jgi:hypothetical protein